MSRKISRELAFKIIFASNFQDEEINLEEMIAELLKEKNFDSYSENIKLEDVKTEDIEYIKDIVFGVRSKVTFLDEQIEKHLKGWTMDRICKTDLAILRLAIYEILYRSDIPDKVSVNEAVELAKAFSEKFSSSFINGLLAEIINKKVEGLNE